MLLPFEGAFLVGIDDELAFEAGQDSEGVFDVEHAYVDVFEDGGLVDDFELLDDTVKSLDEVLVGKFHGVVAHVSLPSWRRYSKMSQRYSKCCW